MDMNDTLINGGVIITHQIHEGKHQYEVKKVMKCKQESGKKMFVRRGDKLMEINGLDLQDLTPEELAQQMSEGNPMLTVHKSRDQKGQTEQLLDGQETLQPVSKESTVLSFSWEMTREEEQEEENETTSTKEEVTKDEKEEEEDEKEEEKELLIIHMTRTSISVVSGRGCDGTSPCQGCEGTGCTFNDIIVVSESSTVTLVPRGDVSFRQEKLADVLIKNVPTHLYLRGICSERSVCASPNPEKITIYYYKSNSMDRMFRGMPVVLNLTDSNCFLRCCREGNRIFLQIDTCEKKTLKQISKSDERTFSFVFYMKSDRTKQRKFESALYKGWFIHIVETQLVEIGEMNGRADSSFLFIIQK